MSTSRIINGVERKLDLKWGHGETLMTMRDFAPRAVKHAALQPIIDLTPWCAPIRDQKNEGSCAGFMGVGLMEDREYVAKAHDPEHEIVRLAEQYVYYAARVWIQRDPASEDTGLSIESVKEELETFGAPPESLWPYGENPLLTLGLEPSEEAKIAAKRHRALLSVWCPTIEEIDASLALGFSVGFGMDLPAIYENYSVTMTGKLPFDVSGGFIGGHAQRIIAKDDTMEIAGDVGAYKVQNQWGTDWGAFGYIWIPKRYWREGIASRNLSIHRITL